MKKFRLCILIVVVSTFAVSITSAHPGRLDSKGGHNVRTAGWGYPVGSYHYHRGSDRDNAYDASGNLIQKDNATQSTTIVAPTTTPSQIVTIPAQPTAPPAVTSPAPTTAPSPVVLAPAPSLVVSPTTPVVAEPIKEVIPVAPVENISDISVIVSGEAIQFDQPPEAINNRTMVPIRFVVEKMGCDVEWDAETETVYINTADTAIEKIASKTENINVYVNNEPIIFVDQQPITKNGRVLIPVRFVIEKLGYTATWDGESQIVYINKVE